MRERAATWMRWLNQLVEDASINDVDPGGTLGTWTRMGIQGNGDQA